MRGYEVEFASQPRQSKEPHPAHLKLTQHQLVNHEITELCLKGALKTLPSGYPPSFWYRRYLETSDQSKKPKLLCSHPTLQDGGNSYPQKPTAEGGLASKDRPEGCIFFHPNQSEAYRYAAWIRPSGESCLYTLSTTSPAPFREPLLAGK